MHAEQLDSLRVHTRPRKGKESDVTGLRRQDRSKPHTSQNKRRSLQCQHHMNGRKILWFHAYFYSGTYSEPS